MKQFFFFLDLVILTEYLAFAVIVATPNLSFVSSSRAWISFFSMINVSVTKTVNVFQIQYNNHYLSRSEFVVNFTAPNKQSTSVKLVSKPLDHESN